MVNPEYKLAFEDEIQRLMFNGGVLTPQSVYAVYSARLAQVDQAIYDESARWGDNQRDLTNPSVTYTHQSWRTYNGDPTLPFGSPSQFGLLANYFPGRTATVLSQFTSHRLVPDSRRTHLQPIRRHRQCRLPNDHQQTGRRTVGHNDLLHH